MDHVVTVDAKPERIISQYFVASLGSDETYTIWDGLGCEWSGLSLESVQKLDAANYYPKFDDAGVILGF